MRLGPSNVLNKGSDPSYQHPQPKRNLVFGVRADIVRMAKALGAALPLGATLSSSSIMDWPPGTHSNTFGGNLLASAASLAALQFMEREDIGTQAKQLGDHVMMRLREMQSKYPAIGDVRGLGLMIGVEIVT